jgi:hypothetical protein
MGRKNETFIVALAYTAECCTDTHVQLDKIEAPTWLAAAQALRKRTCEELGGCFYGDCSVLCPDGTYRFLNPQGKVR